MPGGGKYRGKTNPHICAKTAATWTKKLNYKMIGVKMRPTLYPQHYPVRVAGAQEILARAAQPGLDTCDIDEKKFCAPTLYKAMVHPDSDVESEAGHCAPGD